VLLAGPVPGIVAGTYLAFWGSPEWPAWVPDLAWLMLILNYMNLLPILPLDGGRIMSLALFDRFPKLQLAFSGLSGFALGVAGPASTTRSSSGSASRWWSRSRRSSSRRVCSMAHASGSRSSLRRPSPPDPIPALYTELHDPRFDGYNSETKYQLVVTLAQRLSRRPASAGLAVLAIVGWLGFMLLPVGMVSYQAITTMAQYEAEHAIAVAEAEARIEAADTADEELRARIDAAQLHLVAGGLEDARRQLQPAPQLFAAAGQPELEASALMLTAQIEISFGDYLLPDGTLRPATGDSLRRVLELREQLHGPASLEVADVLEAFPPGSLGDPVAATVRQLRLIDIYERALPEHPEERWQLFTALQNEAALRASYEDFGRAESALLRAGSRCFGRGHRIHRDEAARARRAHSLLLRAAALG
jgi:hypothetical protein